MNEEMMGSTRLITCSYIYDITYMHRTPDAARTYMVCGRPADWVAYEFEPDNPDDDPRDLVPAHRTIVREGLCDLHYQASSREKQKHFEKWNAETFWLGRKSNWATIKDRSQAP